MILIRLTLFAMSWRSARWSSASAADLVYSGALVCLRRQAPSPKASEKAWAAPFPRARKERIRLATPPPARAPGTPAPASRSTSLATKLAPMPLREDEGQPAALDLLVLAHRLQDRRRVGVEPAHGADAGRQADARRDGSRPARRPPPGTGRGRARSGTRRPCRSPRPRRAPAARRRNGRAAPARGRTCGRD